MYFQITIDTKDTKKKIINLTSTILGFIIRPFISKKKKKAIGIYLARKELKQRREYVRKIFGDLRSNK